MAISAVLDVLLPRRAEDVFAALTDLASYPQWLVSSGVVGAEALDPGPLQEGSRLRIEQRLAGRSATLAGRVTTFEPARHLSIEGKDPDGISIVLDAVLTADGATSSLRWSVRISLPLKYRFFESMIGPQAREAAAADLERFRRRLSAVAG
jgi:uncharacterized protein YndB with AHSA1/START domain